MSTITREFTKEQLIELAKSCRMLAQCAVDARLVKMLRRGSLTGAVRSLRR